MLMHAIAYEGCTDTVSESALIVDWVKNPSPHRGTQTYLSGVPVRRSNPLSYQYRRRFTSLLLRLFLLTK